jgi:hypothetical protein
MLFLFGTFVRIQPTDSPFLTCRFLDRPLVEPQISNLSGPRRLMGDARNQLRKIPLIGTAVNGDHAARPQGS